jgi:uncharacterized membrane protein
LSIRHTILDWAEHGAIGDARAALQAAGVLPEAPQWRAFLDRLLVGSAVIALAAAAVFFVAYNWDELGRFARFGLAQVLVVAALLAYWRFGPDSLPGKAALLAGAVFLGALLALFGQIYQTGADTWELFANWAALIVPWVVVGRFAALWMLWIALLNLSIALHYQAFPGAPFGFFGGEPELWALFAFNSAALALWELAARRYHWLAERWWPRLIAIASGAFITALVLEAVFGSGKPMKLAVLAYPVWLVCVYGAYRRLLPDLFMLAGACLSLIIIVAAFMWEKLFRHADSMSLLFIAVAVAAMGALSARWLRQVAREARA